MSKFPSILVYTAVLMSYRPAKVILSSSFMTRSKVSVIGMALWSMDTMASQWTLTSTRCFQTRYTPFLLTQQRINDVNSKLPTTIPNTSRRHAVTGLASRHHEAESHHHHHEAGSFLRRVHRAIMALGLWEGRAVAFVLSECLPCTIKTSLIFLLIDLPSQSASS
jgi:hypothetical protein